MYRSLETNVLRIGTQVTGIGRAVLAHFALTVDLTFICACLRIIMTLHLCLAVLPNRQRSQVTACALLSARGFRLI